MNFNHLKTLISKNEHQEIFLQFELLKGTKYENEIHLLKSRFDNFNSKLRLGTETQENLNVEFARLNYSILQLISHLEKEEIKPKDTGSQFEEWAIRKKDLFESECSSWIGRKINNYKIIEQIGSGGFGNVYLAKHWILNKTVAVKISYPIYNYEDVISKLF